VKAVIDLTHAGFHPHLLLRQRHNSVCVCPLQLREAHSNAHCLAVGGNGTLLAVVGDGQPAAGRRGGEAADADPLRVSVWALDAVGAAGGGPPAPRPVTAYGRRQTGGGWLWARTRPAYAGWSAAFSPSRSHLAVVVPERPLQLFYCQVGHLLLLCVLCGACIISQS
jgi:hypothetical protein